MATFIKGKEVTNATSYELAEKASDGAYNVLASKDEINFELDSLGLAAGKHTLVVKAKADGWEDSDYSNEVTYTVEGRTVDLTSAAVEVSGSINTDGQTQSSSNFCTKEIDVTNYRGKTVEFAFVKYRVSGSGAVGTYGCGYVTTDGTFTLLKANEDSGENGKGAIDHLTFVVPDSAVTLKTVWFTQKAVDNGVYSGSLSDFYVHVKNV